MKQLIENLKNGNVSVIEAPQPSFGEREIVVSNRASLISPGTEKLMIEMGRKSLVGKARARPDLLMTAYQKAKREGFVSVFREAMARLDQPLPLGYSSAGEVVQVGRAVRGVRVGDRVACAGSGFASHAEMIVVPPELCVKIPASKSGRSPLPFEHACFVMLGGIALQGVRCAELEPGENVLVVGLGLIGLLTVQIVRAYGCTVIGADLDPDKCRLARTLGADRALVVGKEDIESHVQNMTSGRGADAVLLTAATKDNSPILLAEQVTRKRGRIVLVGVSDLRLTRKAFWEKELTFTVSKASGPSVEWYGKNAVFPPELVRWSEHRNLEEFLRLMVRGNVRVDMLITHRVSLNDSPSAYEMILGGREPYIGVVIDYPTSQAPSAAVKSIRAAAPKMSPASPPRMGVGLIGAGMFARNVLMRVLGTVNGVRMVSVAAKTGVSANHLASKYKFSDSTTDYHTLLADQRIGSVLITTRHNQHASMVIDALRAGKHVFVEKPLTITKEEVEQLRIAFEPIRGKQMLMVGFNRRYSPLARMLEEQIEGRSSVLQILYRVNAGYIPPDHWTQDPGVGGGRIIGECCHFIDFMQFLTKSHPVEVVTQAIGGPVGKYLMEDNVAISLRFADGSQGTITYSAMGPKAFSRERIEVYWQDAAAVLDDFRSLEIVKGSRRTARKYWTQKMGYKEELQAFLLSDPAIGTLLVNDALSTTLATIAAVESLQKRSIITLS